MNDREVKKKLKQLVKDLNRRRDLYYLASRSRDHALIDKARYEGITTACRWAAEDIEKILKASAKRSKKPETKPISSGSWGAGSVGDERQ